MGARQQLAVALTEALPPTVKIVRSPREVQIEAPTTALVQIVRTAMRSLPQQPLGVWQADWDLWVVVPGSASDANEDALDDALDDVIEALDQTPWLLWDSAERTSHPSDLPNAYKITAHTGTQKETS